VSRRHGVTIDLTTSGDFDQLPDQHRTCVYRVVQEALTNCVRHARASRVHVTVTGHRRGLEVTISDNGIGFDRGTRAVGLGLRGIEERARELNGQVHVRSSKGIGTTLTMTLPLPEAEEAAVAGLAG
jgi:signal transduction histidine kinase